MESSSKTTIMNSLFIKFWSYLCRFISKKLEKKKDKKAGFLGLIFIFYKGTSHYMENSKSNPLSLLKASFFNLNFLRFRIRTRQKLKIFGTPMAKSTVSKSPPEGAARSFSTSQQKSRQAKFFKRWLWTDGKFNEWI